MPLVASLSIRALDLDQDRYEIMVDGQLSLSTNDLTEADEWYHHCVAMSINHDLKSEVGWFDRWYLDDAGDEIRLGGYSG